MSHTAPGSGVSRATKPDLRVELKPAEGTINYGVPGEPTWDSDRLNFVFHGVTADQYRINASLRGDKAYVKSVSAEGPGGAEPGVQCEGRPDRDREIVVSDDTGGVEATVSDDDGKPVATYVILISSSGQERTLVSGDDGYAKDESVPPGEYRAWAFGDIDTVPYAEPDWMARGTQGLGRRSNVTTGSNANVVLKKTAVVTE